MKNEAFPGPNQDRTYNTKKELISIHKAQRDARRKAEKQAEREEHRAQKLKMVQRKELRRDWDSIEKLDDQEALQPDHRSGCHATLRCEK